MVMCAALGLVATISLQAPGPTATAVLAQQAELSPDEIARLLGEVSRELVGKSFFTYGGFGGGALTVGAGPRVRMIRQGDRVEEWLGVPARRCDGERLDGELMVEWRSERSGWRATARATSTPRVLDGMFELWQLEPELIGDAGFREIDGIKVRGLRYPYEPAPGMQFEASWQSVWFDVRTALPVRYEIAIEAPEAMDYGYFFAHAPGYEIRPDTGLARPDCVESPWPRQH